MNASWQEDSWLADCGKGCDCGTVHKNITKLFLYTKKCVMCRQFSWYQFGNKRPLTFSFNWQLVLYNHTCPRIWTKTFSRENACPIIYQYPDFVELFSCPLISRVPETCPPGSASWVPFDRRTWRHLFLGIDHFGGRLATEMTVPQVGIICLRIQG